MYNLKGKKALVTGSSQGIGKEIARALADAGAEVFVHGLEPTEKLSAAADYVGAVGAVSGDIARADIAELLYGQTGDVDILILNASVQEKRAWCDFDAQSFDYHFACNVRSSYLLSVKYAEGMKERGFGRIITIGSVNQYNNHPELLLYGMSKCAQKKLCEGMAKQLAAFGVTVNNIAPGAISTPRNAGALSDADFKARVIASIPAGHIGEACDMNGAVLMLCSEEGRYITGAELVIDGGMKL